MLTSNAPRLPFALSESRASVSTRATGPAFTLIELLVVVAIISILASMLLPVLGKARDKARSTACMNNMKQQALGLQLYADGNDEAIPFTRNDTNAGAAIYQYVHANNPAWFYLVSPYVGIPQIKHDTVAPNQPLFICPNWEAEDVDITMAPPLSIAAKAPRNGSGYYVGKMSMVLDASTKVWLTETKNAFYINPYGSATNFQLTGEARYPHPSLTMNVPFFDYHVETYSVTKLAQSDTDKFYPFQKE